MGGGKKVKSYAYGVRLLGRTGVIIFCINFLDIAMSNDPLRGVQYGVQDKPKKFNTDFCLSVT